MCAILHNKGYHMKRINFTALVLTFSTIILLVSSCSDSSNSTTNSTLKSGIFLDTNSSGVEYTCLPSNKTGFIPKNGSFSYKENDICTFNIGNLTLGSALSNVIITPMQLFSAEDFNTQNVIKTSMLLLSLDSDLNSLNGIQIDSSLSKIFTEVESVENLDNADLQSKVTLAYDDRVLLDSEVAIEYLYNNLDFISTLNSTFTLNKEMISGKEMEFINSNGDTHTASFNSDGSYNDNVLRCTTNWIIEKSKVLIDTSECTEYSSIQLSFDFFETPKNGAFLNVIDNNISTAAIITKIIDVDNILQSTNHWNTGHDYKHITFVNQTNKDICFYADLKTGHWYSGTKDKVLYLTGYKSEYLTVKDWDEYDKIYVDFTSSEDDCDTHKDHDTFEATYTSDFLKTKDVLYVREDNTTKDYKLYHTINVELDKSGCDKNSSKPAILFAHGLHSEQGSWGTFATHAKKQGWRVFRTSVSGNGSLSKRAGMLSYYIETIADKCNIDENSLRVVGHSMGGLDLRLILSSGYSKYTKAKSIIERAYTIATPHKGSDLANGFASYYDDGIKSCSVPSMTSFNSTYDYSYIHNANKSMLAIRYHLNEDVENIKNEDLGSLKEEYQVYEPSGSTLSNYQYPHDGIVFSADMTSELMPYAQTLFKGKHTTVDGLFHYGDMTICKEEQKRTDVLDKILQDYKSNNIKYFNIY